MSYSFYLSLHLVALFSLFLSLGMLIYPQEHRRWAFIVHGLASLLSFVAGFGLIHKSGLSLSLVLEWPPLIQACIFLIPIVLYINFKKRLRLPFLSRFTLVQPFLFLLPFVLFTADRLMLLIQPYFLAGKLSTWVGLAVIFPIFISISQKRRAQPLDTVFLTLCLIWLIVKTVLLVIYRSF